MEDDISSEQNKKKEEEEKSEDPFIKGMKDMMGLKETPKLPNYPINKKAQKKYLKDPFNKKHKSNLLDKDIEQTSETENKKLINKTVYRSGIIKTITKNEKNQIIDENVDYKDIKLNYINYLKENFDKELIKLIENSFLLYNRRPIMTNIVKKPYSTKVLEEKILLWKYYIKNATKDEKALLIRKLIYYLGKFSEKIYKEFINIKEISKAYYIFLINGRIQKHKDKSKIYNLVNFFYMGKSLLGYDGDGERIKDKNIYEENDEIKALLLLDHQLLNVKEELNGTGVGLLFLKELKEIAEMYTNSSYIFESIFSDAFEIIEVKCLFFCEKTEVCRILWNFFSDFFIDDSFVINFLIELKFIFAIFQQDDVIKFMHELVLYRWNTNNIINKIKKKIEKILGKEEILDEKEKVEKMNNIEDVMKYIEGDEKIKKKKKKKKKKNEDKINLIEQLEEEYKNKNKIENDCDDIQNDMDDSMSIISEADSVLNSFKNDIIEETEFNTGNKIVPKLSKEYFNFM